MRNHNYLKNICIMQNQKSLPVIEVLIEGFKIGVTNIASLLVAVLLYILTCWIPYLNVGTTIAISTIPLKLSEGKVISPLFIFEEKYRQYMGEYFTLIGLMMMSLIPAYCFMVIPGMIIAISWSLALFIMLDKGISPNEALIQSNKATYGYKWTIFFINLIIGVIAFVLSFALGLIHEVGSFIAAIVLMPFSLGCQAVIYKKLVKENQTQIKTNNEG